MRVGKVPCFNRLSTTWVLLEYYRLYTQILKYMTQGLGLEEKTNVTSIPFLLLWVSSPRWLLSLQVPELRKNRIKASTLKVVTQDQLMCNLAPLGVWTLQDLLAALWPHQKTMGMLWSLVWMNIHVLLSHSGIPAVGELQPRTCQRGHQDQC